jgi:methyl-accepting chemotaxis protein
VVDRQDDIVNHTIEAFHNMNSGIERLINNLSVIGNNVKNMEGAREGTLNAVESISAVSEETMATSCTIEKTVEDQSTSVKTLEKVADELVINAKDLVEAVNMFQI